MKNEKIMVAMSGGVDSAVAAHLIKESANAAGVTMRVTDGQDGEIASAAAVCDTLGIQHYVADLRADFRRDVIEPFIAAYEAGLTPNPCVFCNKALKFGALAKFAAANGYEKVATGHYARIERDANGRYLLLRAKNPEKDQSYMLYTLSQSALARVLFPLGELKKEEVREIAASLGLAVAHKKDSQDICFIPDGDYVAFIERERGKTPPRGAFLSQDGAFLGEHDGMLRYTIGQRKGLGIAFGKPQYVIAKSAADNTVTLGDNEALFRKRLTVKNVNLIPFDRLDAPCRFSAKARYRQTASPARVEQINDDTLIVEFDTPQRAIAPGQSLVLYDDDLVVGGGIIQ